MCWIYVGKSHKALFICAHTTTVMVKYNRLSDYWLIFYWNFYKNIAPLFSSMYNSDLLFSNNTDLLF